MQRANSDVQTASAFIRLINAMGRGTAGTGLTNLGKYARLCLRGMISSAPIGNRYAC